MANRFTKHIVFGFAIVGLVLVVSATGGAEQKFAAAAEEATEGPKIAAQCVECHGDGVTAGQAKIPRIAGQHADYIAKALSDYRSGARNEDNMHNVTRALSDDDIVALAAYFSGLKPNAADSGVEAASTADLAALDEDPYAAIRASTAGCADCHGATGNPGMPGMPGLAGQHPEYLIAAMRAYGAGEGEDTRPDTMMQDFVADLTDTEIEDMAYYYAAMKPVAAQAPEAGDPYAGRAATQACVTCHGDDGNTSDPKTPRLAGLDAEYIGVAIEAYKDGQRDHTAMQEAAASVREADIADISAFYATKAPKALPARKRLTTAEWVQNCNRCHGPDGKSSDPRYPILAGQSEAYLIKALKLYHKGERNNSMMQAMSYPMSASDIRKLAAYYAAQKPN